ncbi:MAG: hypothetical protein IH840_05280 [Candidatus Heimdallarchaeota archaeon]|nr:hypothetical protein [Candidatus Heimdallarchaeota archaeon]
MLKTDEESIEEDILRGDPKHRQPLDSEKCTKNPNFLVSFQEGKAVSSKILICNSCRGCWKWKYNNRLITMTRKMYDVKVNFQDLYLIEAINFDPKHHRRIKDKLRSFAKQFGFDLLYWVKSEDSDRILFVSEGLPTVSEELHVEHKNFEDLIGDTISINGKGSRLQPIDKLYQTPEMTKSKKTNSELFKDYGCIIVECVGEHFKNGDYLPFGSTQILENFNHDEVVLIDTSDTLWFLKIPEITYKFVS